MEEITLQVSLDEVNVLLTLLGQQPYVQVYALVQKIQQQASAQVNPSTAPSAAELAHSPK